MSSEIPMLSIIKRGAGQFPRFIVAKADSYKNPIYWTGEDWDDDETKAMVFADVNEALWAYHDLLHESVSDQPSTKFVAPIFIEIFGPKPSLRDLRKWLEKTVRIVADFDENGYGPGNTAGLIVADFQQTKPSASQ